MAVPKICIPWSSVFSQLSNANCLISCVISSSGSGLAVSSCFFSACDSPVHLAMSVPVISAPLSASGMTAMPFLVKPTSDTSAPQASVYPLLIALSMISINSSIGTLYIWSILQLSGTSSGNCV